MKKEFPEMNMRPDYSDGDPDKEEDFYVIRHTVMPAVLTENFFMDRLNPDCELMMSKDGVKRIASAHVKAIKKIEQTL
jgi:N-acetylmuramoyl-L-alanine amidase